MGVKPVGKSWIQQPLPLKIQERERVNRLFGDDWDDDEEKTNPGIGPVIPTATRTQRTIISPAVANANSIYTDPSKKKDEKKEEKDDDDDVLEASWHWDPHTGGYHSGSVVNKVTVPPPAPIGCDKIFVYGSLRRGGNLNPIMQRDGFVAVGKSKPEYRMINMENEYPGMITVWIKDEPKYAIVGEIYNTKERTLKFLDSAFEVPANFRREIITLEDGTRAWCYFMHGWKKPFREEDIFSGDWFEWKRGEKKRERDKMAIAKENARLERERHEKFMSQHRSGSTSSGQKKVHISSLRDEDLRDILISEGHDPKGMSTSAVRVECIHRYGMHYLVD